MRPVQFVKFSLEGIVGGAIDQVYINPETVAAVVDDDERVDCCAIWTVSKQSFRVHGKTKDVVIKLATAGRA